MNKKLLAILLCTVLLISALVVTVVFSNTSGSEKVVKVENETFIKGPVLFETDFSEYEAGASLPKGYEAGSPLFDFDSTVEVSAKIEKQGKSKQLCISSVGKGYFLIPRVETQNYIFEAEVLIDTDKSATLGIVNDMQGGLESAHGSVVCAIRLNENKSIWSYYSVAVEDWDSIDAESLGNKFDNPKKNDVVKIKLISYNNKNFLYLDNVLLTSFAQPNRDFDYDNIGFYLSDAAIKVKSLKVTAASKFDLAITKTKLDVDSNGEYAFVDVRVELSKNNDVYKTLYSNGFTVDKDSPAKFGIIISNETAEEELTVDTKSDGINFALFKNFTETDSTVLFNYRIESIPTEMLNKHYTLRAYCGVDSAYFYSDSISISPIRMANDIFINSEPDKKELIKKVFNDVKGFNSTGFKSITFGLFSDFHYKEGMYISSIADMNSIFERAYKSNASFVISAGDMTNDMKGSPELVNAFKNNKYSLGAYNVYGNHELESAGNTMAVVTPTLTNDENVVWGTQSGKIEDGSIGYYYADREGFRLIFLDSNYYYEEETDSWNHNPPAYWGPPPGGTKIQSLTEPQLNWLEEVLMDAAEKDIPCIVAAHNTFSSKISSPAGDAARVREIYKKANEKNPGTVIMSINGHIHTDSNAMEDGVFYFDMNTTRNLWWQPEAEIHYTDTHTYEKEVYDASGNYIETVETPLETPLCWYSDAPLSAIVTVYENGVIEVEGSKADWLYDIVPRRKSANTKPEVTSGIFKTN